MLIINGITIFVLILIPSVILSRTPTSIFSSPNMDTKCNTVITLNGDTLPGTFFSLTSGNYKQNLDCLLTIKGSTVSQRIIVVVDEMDVDCHGDKLLIYDGKRDQGSLLNKDESLQCGTKKYYLRTPNTNTVIIEFISNNDGKVGKGFILNIAINFPVATCSRTDGLFRCKNLNCISNKFNCDTRNWCGDDTQRIACR